MYNLYLYIKEVYKKKNIRVPMNSRIRHSKAMVRNAVLNAAETITLGEHRKEQLEKKKNILRKILGDIKEEVKHGRRDQEINCIETKGQSQTTSGAITLDYLYMLSEWT